METAPNNFFQRLKEFEKYFRKYEVDLFLNENVWSMPPIVTILFAKLFGLKTAAHFHGDLFHLSQDINIKVLSLTDSVVVLSRITETYYRNLGVKSFYIPNPILIEGTENFHGRDPKKNSKTILWVGRIHQEKNPFAAVKILNEVVKKIPDVKLKILGAVQDEKLFAEMKNFIQTNRLENNIEFCGYHKDVGKFYEAADVMLNTSPSEGFSLAMSEGKFYELPLVLYKLERNELVRDGKGFISVEQGDFRGAAAAIVKILTDENLRCKMSAEARASIQYFLDYDIAGAWQKVFDDLDENKPSPPKDFNNAEIQKFFVDTLLQQQMQITNLTMYIEQLQQK